MTPAAPQAHEPNDATRSVISAMQARALRAVVLEQAVAPTMGRLGGGPRLVDQRAWPRRQDRPLSFVAELDLEAVRAAGGPDWLPGAGYLHVFYDAADQPWGFDPADRDGWAILKTGSVTTRPLPPPPNLSPEWTFAPVSLAGRSALTYPTFQRLGLPPDIGAAYEFEAVQTFMDSDLGEGPRHQVGGWPSPLQSDAMELEAQLASNGVYMGGPDSYSDERIAALEAGAGDWRLLLQIDSDDHAGMMWGDSGTLYVWIREQDARTGDFSRPWIILQST